MDAARAKPIPPQDRTHSAAAGASPHAAGRITPLRELELLEAHRGGDSGAIGELLRAYQGRIYSICYRMVRDEHDARDLTQDTMLRVLQGLDSFDQRSKLSTWVIRVTMNCCLSHLRKQRLRRHSSIDAVHGANAPAHPPSSMTTGELSAPRRVEQAEMGSMLLRALDSLDSQMRAVLVLRDMQDLEYEHIGEVLGIPLGTVKSRLFRARCALRAAAELELDRPLTKDDQ
ncbi:MAG: sigma-70 family RNA polymerase sigma factor [Planctomycetes bacterium]|nr:sigma-70 family RNA polymerase sigma factor [Planctomycetota bacterium]